MRRRNSLVRGALALQLVLALMSTTPPTLAAQHEGVSLDAFSHQFTVTGAGAHVDEGRLMILGIEAGQINEPFGFAVIDGEPSAVDCLSLDDLPNGDNIVYGSTESGRTFRIDDRADGDDSFWTAASAQTLACGAPADSDPTLGAQFEVVILD